MNEEKYLKIVDDNGKEIEYRILIAFKWSKTNKYYVAYTDDTKNNGILNVYAAIYYPSDSSKLDPIETEEEWDEVDKRLKQLKWRN